MEWNERIFDASNFRNRYPLKNFFQNIEKDKSSFSSDELREISNYLNNPTSVGLWKLEYRNRIDSGFCEYIQKELEEKIPLKIPISFGKRKIVLKDKEQRDNVISNCHRLTFISCLFTYLLLKTEKDPKFEDFEEYLEEDGVFSPLFNYLDLDKIARNYSDAYEYFKTNIYFEGMYPGFINNTIQTVKDGYIILFLSKNEEQIDKRKSLTTISNRKISFISLNFKPLESLRIFLKKIDRINDDQILRIFSPEDELLSPYHLFLRQTQTELIRNANANKKIQFFLDEYEHNNYEYAINIIGRTFEDYLIEMYETCFRERCPKGMAIGELYDLIEQKTNKSFAKKTVEKPDSKPLYIKINEKIDNIADKPVSMDEILFLLRESMGIVKQNELYLSSKIDEIEKKSHSRSIFPNKIREDILDLLRYRNAISHKSRIPIGDYEASKSIYCFSCVILWWINEKSSIDWRKSQEEILKSLTNKL
jgi:hypothetical protein